MEREKYNGWSLPVVIIDPYMFFFPFVYYFYRWCVLIILQPGHRFFFVLFVIASLYSGVNDMSRCCSFVNFGEALF